MKRTPKIGQPKKGVRFKMSKLTREQKVEIYKRRKQGESIIS